MINIDDASQQLCLNSFNTNIAYSRIIFSSLMNSLPNSNEEEEFLSYWSIISFCVKVVTADNIINEKELLFLNTLLDGSYSATELINKSKKYESFASSIIDTLKSYKEDILNNLIILLILFAISDGEISNKEKELIKDLVK